MKYNPSGHIYITPGTGRGLFSADGYTNYNDATAEVDRVGVYSPEGYLNVTILVSEAVRVSAYAPNGSLNVIEGTVKGWYSPCGAWNVEIV